MRRYRWSLFTFVVLALVLSVSLGLSRAAVQAQQTKPPPNPPQKEAPAPDKPPPNQDSLTAAQALTSLAPEAPPAAADQPKGSVPQGPQKPVVVPPPAGPPIPPQAPQRPRLTITSNGTGGGLWSSTATWAGGVVPTAADDVTIANGDTVTVDTAAVALSLTVGQGVSGILQWDAAVARTLTVGGNVSVAAGGAFQTDPAGTVTTHALSIAGNLTNNGTIDFSTNTNLAGANITFTGAAGATWIGNGNTNLRQTTGVTLNKGTSVASVLDFTPGTGTFTVQGANTAGFLAITNGLFQISGANAFSNPVFAAVAYSIPATGGIRLNNANATVVGQAGSPTNSGLLRLTTGTYNVGTVGTNVMGAGTGATFTVEGGTLNLVGRLASTSTLITYNQSGGTINVCPAGGCATTPSFGFTGAGTVLNVSGGTINLVQANTSGSADYNMGGTMFFTGGTLNIGTAATATNFIFRSQGQMPHVIIDNTTNNKTLNLSGQANVWGNLTINTGTTVNTNPGTAQALVQIGPTLTNNGAIVNTSANTGIVAFAGNLGTSPAQTYAGTGTFGSLTNPIGTFQLQNSGGVTLSSGVSLLYTLRINTLFGAITGANNLGLGIGGANALIIQRGNGSTTGFILPAGTLDVSPTFNIGTGTLALLYAPGSTSYSTGPEIPATRTVTSLSISNQRGVVLAGGPLTATATAAALTLTSGTLTTDATNLLTLSATTAGAIATGSAASYVNGPLERTLPASLATGTTYTFPVGKSAFKMLELVNPTTNAGGTVVVRVEAFDAASGGSAGTGLTDIRNDRYWSASFTSGGANFTNSSIRLTETSVTGVNQIGYSATQGGAYDSIGGTVSGATVASTSAVTALGYFVDGVISGSANIAGGTYTVGAAGTYTTLTAAVAALNGRALAGPVVLSLLDNTYGGETYPITISGVGTNATNTLTIRPAAGITPAFSGSSATGLFVLNGTDRLTIDGSNSGGSSRDLTLNNTNTSTTSAVVWGQTVGTADAATNNTIKNLNVVGNASTTTLVGVGFGSSTIGTTSSGTANSNNTIQNNNITSLQIGVYSQGTSITVKNLGTVITGNLLGGAGASVLGRAGIIIGFQDAAQVTNNTISAVSFAGSGGAYGINLGNSIGGNSLAPAGNEVSGSTVSGNLIGTVNQTSTTGWSAIGILATVSTVGTNRIANNSVYGVLNGTTPSDVTIGIFVVGSSGFGQSIQIYFNSVSMTGNRDTFGASTSMPSYALAIAGTNPIVDIRNNSLYNTQTAANTTAATSYAIGLATTAPFSNITSNYNDLYTSGANAKLTRIGSLGASAGTDLTTLTAWQATTGKDTPNSISADPLYISTTLLQPQFGSPLIAAGQAILGITTDITGAPRGTPPSIGAYENAAIPPSPTPTLSPTITPTPTRTNTPTLTPCATNTPLNETFESTTLGVFTSTVATCVPGGCGWSPVTTAAHAGLYSAFSPDVANIADQQLVTINPIAVPSSGLGFATLSFWHRYTFENTPPNYYDGGVLETSTDGGTTWRDVLSDTTFITGGYNFTLSTCCTNPLAGRPAWAAASPGYPAFQQTTVNLLPYAGQNLLLRFRQGNDFSVSSLGWWVDDVVVTIGLSVCATPTPAPLELTGHVTWQGRPAQPNALNQLPIDIWTKRGTDPAVNYPGVTTDASGNFTVYVTGAPGTYDLWVKGPQYLASAATVNLSFSPRGSQEMGLQLAGDVNNTNLIDIVDFSLLRNSFGLACGDPGYDGRADFTGNCLVDIVDFTLLRNNFGQAGPPQPTGPIRR